MMTKGPSLKLYSKTTVGGTTGVDEHEVNPR